MKSKNTFGGNYSFGFILFENVDQAKSVLPPTIDWAAPGVIINKFDMRRVAVSIP